ncbi:MAG: C4-dicarboxylate transporter DcuC, partial [Turicibacter sp.]
IELLSAPLKRIKSPVWILPLLFIIGNLLCLIIPSASSLSVLLMSTLYPVLIRAHVSPLAIAAIIATSATIAPTPLGADNIIASEALGLSVTDYVFNYHGKLSIIILIIMGIVHIFWQRYLDEKDGILAVDLDEEETEILWVDRPIIYGVLPLLPLIFMIFFGVFLKSASIGIVEVTFLSFIIAILFEMVRTKSFEKGTQEINTFFIGMGKGFTAVATQVIAALIFVEGVKLIGVISMISDSVNQLKGGGFILTLLFCLFAFIIGMLSGSGLALFYAFVELMPAIATSVNISPIAMAIPMQFVSHFVKSISPVSPTIIIISSMMGITPFTLIKRTSVPIGVSIVLSIILSFFLL